MSSTPAVAAVRMGLRIEKDMDRRIWIGGYGQDMDVIQAHKTTLIICPDCEIAKLVVFHGVLSPTRNDEMIEPHILDGGSRDPLTVHASKGEHETSTPLAFHRR